MHSVSESSPTPEPAAGDAALAARVHARPSISCVIPCRNEAGNLDLLLPRLLAVLEPLAPAWEIILVDDGSTDDTPQRLAAWTRRAGIRTVELSRNFGKEAALTAGLQAARGEVVVMLDADLQHAPELIPTLLEKWREGADSVYAVRSSRADESLFKRLGARGFYALVNAGDRVEIPPNAGDFRLMDRAVVEALLALPERNRFMKGLYAWVGFRAVAVPYMPDARAGGRTHFRPMRLVNFALDGLIGFSTWPLRLLTLTGFTLAMLAFGYGLFLVVEYLLHGHRVSGWTTIVVGVMFSAGMQLVALGVVGEYVGRIFEEVKRRPLYIVRRRRGQGLGE
ncbi:MAG: glycosyltransferase family 2 protein [Pseudomonadota bacterium]